MPQGIPFRALLEKRCQNVENATDASMEFRLVHCLQKRYQHVENATDASWALRKFIPCLHVAFMCISQGRAAWITFNLKDQQGSSFTFVVWPNWLILCQWLPALRVGVAVSGVGARLLQLDNGLYGHD